MSVSRTLFFFSDQRIYEERNVSSQHDPHIALPRANGWFLVRFCLGDRRCQRTGLSLVVALVLAVRL